MIKLKDRKGEMKDMCDETVIKFGKWALSILIVLYIGFYGIYFGFYQLINNVDVSIYNSNGQGNTIVALSCCK